MPLPSFVLFFENERIIMAFANRKLIKEKSFFTGLLAITLPIALQQLIVFGVSMADTVMLGQLGDAQLSASAQANQPQFIFQLLIFGISGGGIVLASQYWGKKDMETIRKIVALVLKVAIVASLILVLLVQLFPEQIMKLYIKSETETDKYVISEAVSYLKIVSLGYIFFGLTTSFQNVVRSVEIVKISVVTSSVSFVVNVFLNWIFIFGKFGIEPMGIRGAALATVIARITDFTITAIYAFAIDKRLKFRLKYFFMGSKELSKSFLKYSFPVIANEFMWGAGISVQSAVMGQLDSEILAANSISSVFYQLITIITFGVANAAAVTVGKFIGGGDMKKAKDASFTIMLMAICLGLISGLTMFLLRKAFVSVYNVTDDVRVLAENLIAITSVVAFFAAISTVSVVGVLRGAGDTRFTFKLELITLWCFAVPMGAIAGFVLDAPILLVCALLKIDEPIKSVVAFIRTFKDSTYKNVTEKAEL